MPFVDVLKRCGSSVAMASPPHSVLAGSCRRSRAYVYDPASGGGTKRQAEREGERSQTASEEASRACPLRVREDETSVAGGPE